jgi:hypothetical protein
MARAGNFFSMSNDLRQRSEDESQTMQERDRLRKEAENLYAGGLELWGQMDAKPKAGGKKNPVMQVLQYLNPLAKRGDTGDTEFEETFSRILSGLGPQAGGGGEAGAGAAPGVAAAAPGIAAAMENPAAAGFEMGGPPTTGPPLGPVGGFSSAMQGEVGGMTVAPTAAVPGAAAGALPVGSATGEAIQAGVAPAAVPGAAPGAVPGAVPGAGPPETPYVSPYFRDPKAEKEAVGRQITTIFRQLRDSFAAKKITTIEGAKADKDGMQILQQLQILADDNDFTQFDELDEIFAGLGLQEARSAKDTFEQGYFDLAQKQAQGEDLTEQQQRNLEKYRQLRRTGSDARLSPKDQMFEAALARNTDPVTGVIDHEKAYAEWAETTAKEGTQGFSWRTAINPATGHNEIVSFNNRTGTWEFTNLRVPTGFSIDDVMTKDVNQVDQMDGGKIEFFHRQGDFDYATLEWFLTQIPPTIQDRNRQEVPNPQYTRLKKYFESVPKPPAPKIATIDDIKFYATARQESYEQIKTWLEGKGFTIEEGG